MGYKENLKNNIKGDDNHPMNCGIRMQIHHLISQSVVSRDDLKPKLDALKYKINNKENLVALPSSLAGACHLEVQLHRGNHTKKICSDDMDNDKYHKMEYHDYVFDLVLAKLSKIEKKCEQGKSISPQKRLNDVSYEILEDIKSFILPLTSCFKEFEPEREGCANCNTVPELNDRKKNGEKCDRNHKNFKSFQKRKYVLEVGK